MEQSALAESRKNFTGSSSESSDDRHPSRNFQKISGKDWGVSQFRKLRAFPFSVFFIVGNEFCERFCYYGMRTVLFLFLHEQLLFSENRSTAIFHAFSMLCYFLPVLGAIISDSCLGKYWTILSLSVIYCIGNITMSVSAIPFETARAINIALAATGLIVIAFGTGGIKPCVATFGGEQFKGNQSGNILRRFFALFYYAINIGSLLSMLLTPILRPFGVPAVLMIIASVLFVAGTRFYVITKPKKGSSTLFFKVPFSVATAIYHRIKLGKIEGKRNLFQYAYPRYSEEFMEEVRLLLHVCVMFLPIPVFFALFNQQGSKWTLQASKMNGKLGGITIQPDQMQALNPILMLASIPIFETVVYPLFEKCNLLKKPLQRIVTGMLLASIAFIVAGLVQLKIQAGDKALKAGETKLVVFNTLPTDVPVLLRIESADALKNISFSISYEESKVLSNIDSLTPGNYSLYVGADDRESYPFQMVDKSITQMVLAAHTNGTIAFITGTHKDTRPDGSHSSVQAFNTFTNSEALNVVLTTGSGEITQCTKNEFETSDLSFMDISNRTAISIGQYRYVIYAKNGTLNHTDLDNENLVGRGKLNLDFNSGAVYMIVVSENQGNASSLVDEGEQYKVTGVEIDEPNSVSIFLQVPMYVIITAGEVMLAITSLEFAYSQAPVSMKALCLAVGCISVGLGDLIVIIVAESNFFQNRAIEFFFFAGLMLLVSIIYAIMSYFYKYVDPSSGSGDKLTSRDSAYSSKSHDESSALIVSSSRVLAEPILDKVRS